MDFRFRDLAEHPAGEAIDQPGDERLGAVGSLLVCQIFVDRDYERERWTVAMDTTFDELGLSLDEDFFRSGFLRSSRTLEYALASDGTPDVPVLPAFPADETQRHFKSSFMAARSV
jgi:hypothetical protein